MPTRAAKVRARQARRRQDFTHKLTTDLAKNHGWVAVENLRVKGMTKSAKGTREKPGRNVKARAGLNRAVLDNAPYERQHQLAYKAPRFGSELRLVRPAFTSQICSACGLRDPKSRPGCGRLFACTACGHVEHADLNAARKIHMTLPPGRRCTARAVTFGRRGDRAGCVNHSGASSERSPGIPAFRAGGMSKCPRPAHAGGEDRWRHSSRRR